VLCLIHRIQHELEASSGQAIFVDSSVSDTICTCLVMGNNRIAEKLRNDFKVSLFLNSGSHWRDLENF
jgi:hypothetical protein